MNERLWAGWRMKYIENASGDACLFCDKSHTRPGRRNLVLVVSEKSLVMLNAFPYNCGHLMVAPRRHVGSLSALSDSESLDLMRHLSLCERALKKVYRPHGFNVGSNLGKCAGAGVLGHLHIHVVPRWSGDTNYMSTISSTKVLPEALSDTYKKLRTAMDEIVSGSRKGTGKRHRGTKK